MDPFLEDPAFWEGFHDVLITCCMFNIEQGLPEGYISNVKERAEVISVDDPAAKVFVPDIGLARELPARPMSSPSGAAVAVELERVTIPSIDSIEVREAYIEIQRMPGFESVTVIELMSPWNKNGAGIGIHRGKRAALVREGIHFVEIDLLRGGTRTKLARPLPTGDYYTHIFRGDRKPDVDVTAWKLTDKVPSIGIPLRAPDPDVTLNLADAVRTAYEQGRYDRKLRYNLALDPPLNDQQAKWTQTLLESAGR